MQSKNRLVLIGIGCVIILLVFLYPRHTKLTSVAKAPESGTVEGRALAERYCQSCHAFPEPSLLTKEIWAKSVLPSMGLLLGATPSNHALDSITESFFPRVAVIDQGSWQKLQDFYVNQAPLEMPAQRVTLPVRFGLPNFEVKLPDSAFFSKLAIATVVKIDSKRQQIYVGDGMANRLYSLDRQLTILEKVSTPGPVVDINLQAGSAVATIIGKDFNANNLKNGMLAKADLSPMGIKGLAKYNNFGSLGRPLKALSADFNKDGLPDQLIAEFGNMLGRLTWRENMGKGVYQTHVLRDFPGAIDLKIDDYDHDGLPDIWALFAQADEAIYLYANIGDGKFTEKRIMSFPPSYGSSSFQRIDFNRDGLTDILYTCGDNADLSKILKPYHGIYLYLNEGGNKFKLRYFHPINGCYKAIAKDFDLDGDLDIAAISAFPAAITPWEAFVYLQNNGNYAFQPFALPKDIPFQKGLTMDVGDVDGDGKPELLLGNKFYTSSSGSYREPLLVLLKNRNAVKK